MIPNLFLRGQQWPIFAVCRVIFDAKHFSREPADTEWLARWFFEQAQVERLDAERIGTAGRGDLATRLREASKRSATQARRLYFEAGAAQRAPQLLAEVDAFLAASDS